MSEVTNQKRWKSTCAVAITTCGLFYTEGSNELTWQVSQQVERESGYSRLQHDAGLLDHQCSVCFARRTARRPVSIVHTADSRCIDGTHRLSGRVRVAVARRRQRRESVDRAARAGSASAATPWRSFPLCRSCWSGYSTGRGVLASSDFRQAR